MCPRCFYLSVGWRTHLHVGVVMVFLPLTFLASRGLPSPGAAAW